MIEVTLHDSGGRWITVRANTIDEAVTQIAAAPETIKEIVHDRQT